jgi:hypothetical protein
MGLGNNVAGLHEAAQALLRRREAVSAAHHRIATSDAYKQGDQAIAAIREKELGAETQTLRLLIDYAFG